MKWLTVEGCPRSGTTIFGEILNAHPDICLMHEFNQRLFFDAISMFFSEEDRLSCFGALDDCFILPRKSKHFSLIISKIFEAISGKKSCVVGVKFPGAHLWPQPNIQSSLIRLHIVLVRDPMATVVSYIKKMNFDLSDSLSEDEKCCIALAEWISAWNYAVKNFNNEQFFIVLYGDVAGDDRLCSRIGSFLGVKNETLLNFSRFNSTDRTTAEYEADLRALHCEKKLPSLRLICDLFSQFRADKNSMIGWPLVVGDEICLSRNSSDQHWVDRLSSGFYPAETDGRWIRGDGAQIPLALLNPLSEYFILHMYVVWAFEHEGASPIISVILNGTRIARRLVSLGENNGSETCITWPIRFKQLPKGSVLHLALECENPKNPAKLGCGDDDRDLSIMVKSLRFENFVESPSSRG